MNVTNLVHTAPQKAVSLELAVLVFCCFVKPSRGYSPSANVSGWTLFDLVNNGAVGLMSS